MITLDQAKQHLRVDFGTEDADITLKLQLAAAIVNDYIGVNSPIDSQSLDVVDAVTLLVLGELYANRESSADPLSPSVRVMLERLRAPVIA